MINIKRVSAVLIGGCVALSSTFAHELPDDNAFIGGARGGGIKLGPSFANAVTDWVAFGPSVSGYLTYQISPRFAFQPEVMFSQRGYQRGLVKEMFNQALSLSASALPDYFNVNAFMTYSLNKRLHVFAGPSLGTDLNRGVGRQDDDEDEFEDELEEELEQELEEEFEDEDGIEDDENARTRGPAGSIVSGAEYSLVGPMSLSVRYNLGLLRRNDPNFGIKNHVFQIMLMYKF